jgi:ubiquinone/menaquinone biosynthesis C-methylase UbiE
MKKVTLDNIIKFWDNNPLFSGESNNKVGTKKFFKEHDDTYHNKVFLSEKEIKKKVLFPKNNSHVLDLGCGIGFWTNKFSKELKFKSLVAADISQYSLEIAKLRIKNKNVKYKLTNAQQMNFKDETFDHINCQGVIHHSPNMKKSINEIARCLKKNGTASIGIYYKNYILKNYNFFYRLIPTKVFKNLGRGRNFKTLPKNYKEIVRLYDGIENPCGYCLSTKEFKELLVSSNLKIINFKYSFFPFRFLNIKFPFFIKKIITYFLPFFIIANVKKEI